MGLLDALRSGIKTADKITKPLQASVVYQQIKTRDEYGATATSGSTTTLKAIVDFKSVPVRNREGVTVMTSAVLTLLSVAEITSKTNGQGVDYDDVFTLPNGHIGKVVSVGGFMDAGTGRPVATTVMLG